VLEHERKPTDVQDQYVVAVKKKKKNGNNHRTFTTKVVQSVFVPLVARGDAILYSDWGRRYS